jgi:cytochrome c peroxidase
MRCFSIILVTCFFLSCSSSDESTSYEATPVNLEIPPLFNNLLLPPLIPIENPQTLEGIALGRKLFYDPLLSNDGTQACASCHLAENSFTDPNRYSTGITGEMGTRNAMPIFNLVWNFQNDFLWDGSASSLEDQVDDPIENPIEMNNTWPNVVATLQATSDYPDLFEQAFGTTIITREFVAKAIAQFERTLISGNSKFDQYLLGDNNAVSAQEINGFNIFMDENRGDCFHCHGNEFNPLWTNNAFHNNGLDSSFEDLGLGGFTGDPLDYGKFKSPSLRNLAYTAPYMHDGRFANLDEVINHYSEGLVYSNTVDPLMKNIAEGGAQLTDSDKADLKAFLLSLSEPEFTTNPAFLNPN